MSSEKKIIYYARFGRILSTKRPLVYLQNFVCLLISVVLLLNVHSVTYAMSFLASILLRGSEIRTEFVAGLFSVDFIEYPGRFPSVYETTIYLWGAILALLVLERLNFLPAPWKVFGGWFLLILLTSSLFFYFVPHMFPYSSGSFSLLYVLIEVGILSFIPIVLGISLSPLNVSYRVLSGNILLVFFTLGYAFTLGVVRYVAMLYILKTLSYIWMANLFFNLGPLLDMIYVSGIYSIYLSILSEKYSRGVTSWRWTY
ncbi:MAG: hypothetical protein V2G50_04300 [bacterium JZ-2024 1]